jgi:hypothetical protein
VNVNNRRKKERALDRGRRAQKLYSKEGGNDKRKSHFAGRRVNEWEGRESARRKRKASLNHRKTKATVVHPHVCVFATKINNTKRPSS